MNNLISGLHKAFDIINEDKFNNSLPTTVISIIPKKPKTSDDTGFCSKKATWQDTTTEKPTKLFEIGIYADVLSTSYEEIIGALLHQMVHLNNLKNKSKDLDKKIHNEVFKTSAESVGFTCDEVDDQGYVLTMFTDELKQYINGLDIDKEVFYLSKVEKKKSSGAGGGGRKPQYTYECPKCSKKVKSDIEKLHIECKDCSTEFLIKDGGK